MQLTMLRTAVTVTCTLVSGARSSGGAVRLSTTVAPGANLTGLHTFCVLNAPQRRSDAPAAPANDPTVDNSLTNRQLRADLLPRFVSPNPATQAQP